MPAHAVSIYTPTDEAADTAPKREIVGTYENIRGRESAPIATSRVVEIRNVPPERIVETVSKVIPNLIVVKNDDTRSVVLRGDAADVKEAAKLIASLDKRIPQILIECKVVEVSENGLSDIGLIWGREQGNFKFAVNDDGTVMKREDIECALDALVASGKAKLIADPRAAALDGKEAEINIGSRVPYAVPAGTTSTTTQWTVEYIDAGVNLKILPNIAGDGTITSAIKPEVSNISEWRTTSAGEFPVISTRNASVTVRMKDGETLVIGGLINESERRNRSGIPLLSDIPVIGWLFQRDVMERSKTDVIFLITPHIMK